MGEAAPIETGRVEIYCVVDGVRQFLGLFRASETMFGGTAMPGQLIALAPEGATIALIAAADAWQPEPGISR